MGGIAVNSIYLTVEKAAHNLFGLFLAVGVARMLGEGGLGNYTYAIALTAFFVPVLDVGLNNRAIKAVASGGAEARRAASDAVALKLALAPAALVVMGATAWMSGKSPEVFPTVVLLGGATVAMCLGDAVNSIFKGLQRPAYSTLLVGGLNALIFGTGLWAMGAGLGLVGVSACYFLCRSAYLGAGLALVGRVAPDLRPTFRPAMRRDLFVHGLLHLPAPYLLGNLLKLNYMTTYFAVGEAESGHFAIGYQLATGMFVLASANLEAVLPALAHRFRGAADIGGMLLRASGTLLILTLLGVGVVQVAAPVAVVWVFGARFAPAVPAVRLLAWTLPPFALCGLAHTALLAVDRQRMGTLTMLAMVAVGTGLGIAADGLWGARGTALAPTATGALFAVILWAMVWREARKKG